MWNGNCEVLKILQIICKNVIPFGRLQPKILNKVINFETKSKQIIECITHSKVSAIFRMTLQLSIIPFLQ